MEVDDKSTWLMDVSFHLPFCDFQFQNHKVYKEWFYMTREGKENINFIFSSEGIWNF